MKLNIKTAANLMLAYIPVQGRINYTDYCLDYLSTKISISEFANLQCPAL